jgi:hypothetical protein
LRVAARVRGHQAQLAVRVDRDVVELRVQAAHAVVAAGGGDVLAVDVVGRAVGLVAGEAELAEAHVDVLDAGAHARHVGEEGVDDVHVVTIAALAHPEQRLRGDVHALHLDVGLLDAEVVGRVGDLSDSVAGL